jgi:hypothetical protein
MSKQMNSSLVTREPSWRAVANQVADPPLDGISSRYCAPEAIRLGSAVHLIKQNISGQLIDGTDGWYVWGS